MSEPAVDSQPKQAAAAPPQKADAVVLPAPPLRGSLSPTDIDIKLPKTDALGVNAEIGKLTDAIGAKEAPDYNRRLQKVSEQMTLVRNHSHFFTNSTLDSYSKILQSTVPAIAEAIESKKPEDLKQALAKLEAKLKILEKFVTYEKEQGLAGTHAESGVRIYVKNDKIYLCTPDKAAFKDVLKDPQKKEELEKFVQAITGITAIDFAKTQETKEENGVTLLSCRIDNISAENGKTEIQLKTKVRDKDDPTKFEWKEITFSIRDLKAGALGNGVDGFNGKDKVPEVHIYTGQNSSSVQPTSTSATILGVTRPMAQYENLTPKFIKRGAAAIAEKAGPTLQAAKDKLSKAGSYRQVSALKVIADVEADIKTFKASDIDSAEAAAKKFGEMEAKSKSYHQAVERRVAALEKELANETAGTNPAKRIQKKIDNLLDNADREVIQRKRVLEKQLQHAGDDATKLAAKKALVEMKDEITSAYDRAISRSPDSAPSPQVTKADVAKTKATFETTVKAYEAELPPGMVSRAKLGASAWFEKTFPTVKSWYEKAQAIKISRPQFVDTLLEKVRLKEVSTATAEKSVASSTKTLAEAPADAKGVAKQLKNLDSDCSVIDRRVSAIEGRKAKGAVTPELDTELTKLKDKSAEITLKRKELIERQIAELGDDAKAIKLKDKLFSKMGQKVEDAYRQQGKTAEADEFAKKRTEHNQQAEHDALMVKNPELAKSVKARELAEQALKDAADGTPLKLEKQAALDVAKAQENIARQRGNLKSLEDDLYFKPEDPALKTAVEQAKKEIEKLLTEEKAAQTKLVECKRNTVIGDLADIQTKLSDTTNPPDDATKSKLESEQAKLKAKQLEYEAELGIKPPSLDKVNDLSAKIKAEEAKLASEKDAIAKTKIKDDIAKLTEDLNKERARLAEAELQSTQAAKGQLETAIKNLDDRIKGLAADDPALAELKECKEQLNKKLKELDTTTECLEGQKQVAELQVKVSEQERNLAIKKKELAALSPDDTTRSTLQKSIEVLESDLALIRKQANAVEGQFNTRMSKMWESAKATYRSNMERFKHGENIKNPIKTAMLMGMACESIRGVGMASYEDGAKHPTFPTLLYLLKKDLKDWEFETKDHHIAVSYGAELLNGAGNTGIAASVIIGGQKTLAATVGKTAFGKVVGQKLATQVVGKTLAFGGAAVDGFLSFSDGSFVQDNNTQLAVRTGSPIVVGAAFGSFFGPPGAIIGAGAGAIGEAGGAFYYVGYAQGKEINADWRKRSVKDSINNAMQGFVHPSDSSTVQSRSSLNSEEKGVIEIFARDKFLHELFHDEKKKLSPDELERAGFKLPVDDPENREHNWENAKLLIEGRSGFNPKYWIWGDYIDDLRTKDSTTANKFQNLLDENRKHFEDLYIRSMRVVFNSVSDKTKIIITDTHRVLSREELDNGTYPQPEFAAQVKNTAEEFAGKFRAKEALAKTSAARAALAQEQWEFLATKFPELGKVMINESNRQNFVNNFDQYLPKEMPKFNNCALWTEKHLTEIGNQIMVLGGMKSEIMNPANQLLDQFNVAGSK